MKTSFSLYDLSHNSYYMVGSEILRHELKEFLKNEHGLEVQANPDFFESFYESFTIDDARKIKEIHGIRPVEENGKKFFIIALHGITVEAQNALLKLLEEPASYAYFFLIVPSSHILLSTVKSRLALVETYTNSPKNSTHEGERFLKLSPTKRLDMIKDLVDDIAKEKKTKHDVINLLNEIEFVIYSEKSLQQRLKSLSTIAQARKYIHDRAPSIKMLLESVALNC